jgi:hypothetical protein
LKWREREGRRRTDDDAMGNAKRNGITFNLQKDKHLRKGEENRAEVPCVGSKAGGEWRRFVRVSESDRTVISSLL